MRAFNLLAHVVKPAQETEPISLSHIQACRDFHNDLINLLTAHESLFYTQPLEEEISELHVIANLIADKIFPHNHEQ